MIKVPAIFVFLLLFCGLLIAQPDVRKISVTGKSSATLEAQYSSISIRVKETDKEMAASHKKLNSILNKLFTELVKSGITEDDITKSVIDQGADYRWQDNERILVSYFSSCIAMFDVNDLGKLPAIYEILAKFEQITIMSSTYERHDTFEKRKIELKRALQAAKEKAEFMADIMGCKLGKVKEINEVSWDNGAAGGVYANTMRMEKAPDVSFGSVTISATVHVEFYIE